MICNKCGKNNAAGADFCSSCKEPMSPLSNCGGFADILSYEAAPQPASSAAPAAAEPVSVPRPAPAVARRAVAPSSAVKRGNEEFFSKKNIISIVAIALCVVTLIVVLVVACLDDGSNEDVFVPQEPNATGAIEPEEKEESLPEIPEKVTITIAAENLPEIPNGIESVMMTIEDDKDTFKFKINDQVVEEFELTTAAIGGEVVNIEVEVDGNLPSDYVLYIKYDSEPKAKVNMQGEIEKFAEEVEEDPNEMVIKTGEVNLEEIGFREQQGTRVAVYYGKQKVNTDPEDELYKTSGNMFVPIKVEVPRGQDSVEVIVKYSGVTKKGVTVDDLKIQIDA